MKQATFAILRDEGRLLLTKRRDVPLWVLPGGGIDLGETPELACIREVKEETGLDAVIVRKSHLLKPLNRLASLTHLFVCQGSGTLSLSSPESLENRYFSLDDLPKDLFWPHRLWVEEALSSKNLIERPLNEISWKNLFVYALRRPYHILRFAWTRFITN